MAKKKQIPLEDIIRANPGCHVILDNDCWWLYKAEPYSNPYDEDDYEGDLDDEARAEAYDEWEENNEIASSDDYSGNCYGEAILFALAKIVGVNVEWC